MERLKLNIFISLLIAAIQVSVLFTDVSSQGLENAIAPKNGASELKIRQKRYCFHSCVKPIVRRHKISRVCAFSPCDPPPGKYYVMSDPTDKKCYCYGKGQGLPMKKRGKHEWWKAMPREKTDPNANVVPDYLGQCTCTTPQVVLDNRMNPKTVYNDR